MCCCHVARYKDGSCEVLRDYIQGLDLNATKIYLLFKNLLANGDTVKQNEVLSDTIVNLI